MTFIFIFLLFALGLWFIGNDQFIYDRIGSQRKVLRQFAPEEKSPAETAYEKMVLWFSKRIRLSPYRKNELSGQLSLARIDMTPEQYIAEAVVQPLLFAVVAGVAAYLFWPILTVIVFLVAMVLFRKKLDVVSDLLRQNREEIEEEMPVFVAVACSHFKYSRDAISLFEKYRMACGPALRHELDLTLADIRTGSTEQALLHLDHRVHSKMLSQVIRGILSVCRGDAGSEYFEQLQRDFKNEEKERLRKLANERPNELKVFQYGLLFSFLAAVVYCLVMQILNGVAQF